jgi:endonuclease YncB( thermonuclease family)
MRIERNRRNVVVSFLAAVVCSLVAPLSFADSLLSGRVVGVADGDTVTVLDASFVQHKIRVSGIDAPEKGQPFGARSKQHLSSLAMGRQVLVHWRKTDRYGRIVGLVEVNGNDAGLEQVRSGLAWHYRAYAREQSPEQQQTYASAEQEARVAHRGLWLDTHPVAPWDYRAARRHGTDQRLP